MFNELIEIFRKPLPFEKSNSIELWNDPHISKQMLNFHLDPTCDPASRNKKFMDRSINWISQKFNVGPQCRILDLGCGPGLYTCEFAKRGARVTGIDVSENSIAYAKNKAAESNLTIDYVCDNYVTCDFKGMYDLVTLIYDDYCVLNPNDRKTLLRKVLASLDQNGSFILDVLTVNHFNNVQEKQNSYYSEKSGFWSPESHFVFENQFKYENEHIILQKNTVIGKSRQFSIHNYLKCFERDEIMNELSENGFHTVEYFSDISGTEYNKDSSEIALVNVRK